MNPRNCRIKDFVKLTASGSNITVAVDTNGAADGANWADVCTLDNYDTPGNDLTILIDNTDYDLKV